jgi:hypothetical protein
MSNTAATRSDHSGLTRRRFIQAAAVGAGALVFDPVLRPDRAAGPQSVSGASSLADSGRSGP